MPKCIWCGKETNELTSVQVNAGMGDKETVKVCSDECGKSISDYTNYVYGHIGLFALGLILPFIAGITLCIISLSKHNNIFASIGVLVMLAGIGLTIFIFPFTTPQTNEKYGAKRAIKIGKALGIIVILLSILLFFLVQLK